MIRLALVLSAFLLMVVPLLAQSVEADLILAHGGRGCDGGLESG